MSTFKAGFVKGQVVCLTEPEHGRVWIPHVDPLREDHHVLGLTLVVASEKQTRGCTPDGEHELGSNDWVKFIDGEGEIVWVYAPRGRLW